MHIINCNFCLQLRSNWKAFDQEFYGFLALYRVFAFFIVSGALFLALIESLVYVANERLDLPTSSNVPTMIDLVVDWVYE